MLEHWTKVELGSIVNFVNGRGFKSSEWTNEGLPIIRISNLNGDQEFNRYNGDYDKKHIVHKNDLLFSWSGNRGTSFGPHRWKGPKGLLNQHIFNVHLKDKTKVDEVFLYYSLLKLTIMIENSAHGGSGLVHVKKSDLVKFKLPFPSLKEQKKIAAILSLVDEAIDKTKQIIEQTTKVKKGLMQQLLTKGIEHTEFKQSEIGEIPVEWEVTALKDISDFITKGSTPTTYGFQWQESGIKFFKSDVVKKGRFVYGDYKYISNEAHSHMSRSKISAGELVITITGNIGRVAIVPQEIDEANINQHIAKVKVVNSAVNPEFIYHWFNQEKIVRYYELIKTGLAYPQISLKQVRETLIPLPPKKEQEKITEILSSFDNKIIKEEKTSEKLTELKKGLMQQLLTGRTRVPIDDEDEVMLT